METRERVERALILAQQQDDQAEILFCTWVLGLALVSEDAIVSREANLPPAVYCFQQCLEAYRAAGDHFWLGQTLEKLGHTYRRMNLCDLAIPPLQESLTLRRTQGDRFGIARSLRELAWARFNQGLEGETFETAQGAYELQIELGDQQGIADSRFFLALCLLCCGDWQRAKELLILVQQFATATNYALYQRWALKCLTIAACMEENMRLLESPISSFPNRFNVFTARLFYLLFSMNSAGDSNLQKLFRVATTDQEKGLCLLFSADLLSRSGQRHRAVALLALALRHSEVAGSWIMLLPEILALQQELLNCLPPAEYLRAWEQGQALDIQVVTAELSQWLANKGYDNDSFILQP